MPRKNLLKFTYLSKEQNVTAIIYKSRYFIVIAIALVLLALSCKKGVPPYVANVYEQYFETNILNRDYKVIVATDNGSDLTSQFADYKFKLLKNTYFDGPMTATRISDPSIVYTGTWSSNDDLSKLVISINQPSVPVGFNFLNRPWKFTQKGIPVMELAPWGTTEPKVLHMERQ